MPDMADLVSALLSGALGALATLSGFVWELRAQIIGGIFICAIGAYINHLLQKKRTKDEQSRSEKDKTAAEIFTPLYRDICDKKNPPYSDEYEIFNFKVWEDIRGHYLFLKLDAETKVKIGNFYSSCTGYHNTRRSLRIKLLHILPNDFRDGMSECIAKDNAGAEIYDWFRSLVGTWDGLIIEGVLRKGDNPNDDDCLNSFRGKLSVMLDREPSAIGVPFVVDKGTLHSKAEEFWKNEVDKLMEDGTVKALIAQRKEVREKGESLAKDFEDMFSGKTDSLKK